MPLRLIHNAAFDTETTHLLGLAYDRASAELANEDASAHEVMAKRLIEAARRGERDIDRLVEYGLARGDGFTKQT
jgi:hypothetical protein